MSSVISYKSSATNQTSYSVRSELRSAVSGYSRSGSAYSQKRKEVLDHERKSEMNDLVQKQLLEQERHKKLMLENKKRTKMQQEQLKKELEDKRIAEEELLRKMKEEKQTAYMKYLKENSKEILQNFKKKDSNGNPDESKNHKKAPLAPINYAKNKPTSAEPLPPKASRSRLSGISNNQGGHYNKPASANSNLNLPRVREVPQEQIRQETTPDNNNNLNALDLDFNRSTNNFKKIIDQYHKEMHQLKSQQGPRTQPDEMAIPLQQFYDAQVQQYLPAPPSKLLESLDLSSSLTKWDPSKPLDPSLEPFWHVEDVKKVPKEITREPKEIGKYGNYGGYGRQEHRKEEPEWEKDDEENKEEEVDEIIEPCEDDSIEYDKASNVSSNINGRNIQRKKLVKASEVSQKELKQNWHLQYIDSQSQIKSKPPAPGMSITPKNLPSLSKEPVVVVANKDPKSLGSIPNEQPKPEQKEPRKIISAKEARESLEKEMDFGNYGVFQQQTGLNFKWAAEAQEDDFYKGLDRQVPSRNKNQRDNKNIKEEKKIENKKAVVQDSGSKMNAMFADEEWEGISNAPSQLDKKTSVVTSKPEVKKNTRIVKAEEVKKINPVPKINSKPASVVSNTSQTKKVEDGKENKSRNSGLVSKLQGQVKAAAQGIPHNKAKKPPVNKGGRRPDSPTTKCTRDTDLDVEEFLKDDFELLNKEEAHLQREILDMHAQKIGKVRAVEQKHNINTAYQNTQQYVNKNPVPQSAGGSQNEDDLEESLERLDIILAKQRNAAGSNKAIVNPPNQQNKPSQPQVYQKESSLYNQVMQQPIPKPQQIQQQIPQYQPAIQDNTPPINPYRDVQSNPGSNYPPQGPQGGAGYGSGYTNYPQPMQNISPYDPYYAAQHHQQQQVYANINIQGGPGGPQGYPMGQQEPVYSPEFGYNKGLQVQNPQQYPYYQAQPMPNDQQFMQQKPQYPMNQPQNMMGYQPQGQQGSYGRNGYDESFGNPVQGQGQAQNNEYQDQLQLIYGNGLKISQMAPEGENEEKMKAFSFGNNGPVKGGYGDLAKGNNQVDNSDKHSVVSSKATDMTIDKSVNEERGAGGSYANKKQGGQPKETKGYGAAKKPAANKAKEGNHEEVTKGEGDVKIVANTNLKHLLFE